MRISQWSVAKRLAFGFGLLGAMLTLTLLYSVYALTNSSVSVSELADERIPKIEKANYLIDNFNSMARATYLLFVDNSGSFHERMYKQMEDATAEIDKHITTLDSHVVQPEGQRLFDEVKRQSQELKDVTSQLTHMVRNNELEKARLFTIETARPALNKALKSADEFISHETQTGQSEALATTNNIRTANISLIIAGFVAAIISIAAAIVITRSLLNELGSEPRILSEAAKAIATGDFDYQWVVTSKHDNSVAASMQSMRLQLMEGAKLAVENARIRAALDRVGSNVMIADNARNIIYLNDSVLNMLRGNEAEIRRTLPNFSVSQLAGASIDVFHQNPSHQKNLLERLTSSYNSDIKIGPLHFSLTINPVFKDGERLGSVVEWIDRTTEVNMQDEIAGVIRAAAQGNFSRRIDEQEKQGFFLDIATGVNTMTQKIQTVLSEIARVMDALEDGNLTERVTGDYDGTFGNLKDNVNNTIDRLSEVVLAIREAALTISSAAAELSAGNAELSTRTEQQACSVEETASSMEQLSTTVKQNAHNSREANSQARQASSLAERGGNVVSDVVKTMSAINESARKISDIITVIDGIAFQTNILALNAAVEAARAGEQGRGFAVVAGEVRNLAQRSASAAKEIKALIANSVDKVEQGDKLVAQAGSTMDEVVAAIRKVAELMSEISNASEEQSRGIEQVGIAIKQIDETTQHNAALVEESAATAESMTEQAQTLNDSVSIFKVAHESSRAEHRINSRSVKRSEKSTRPMENPSRRSAKALPKLPKSDDDDWAEF